MQLNGFCFKMCGGSIKSFSVAFKYFGAPTKVLHFPPSSFHFYYPNAFRSPSPMRSLNYLGWKLITWLEPMDYNLIGSKGWERFIFFNIFRNLKAYRKLPFCLLDTTISQEFVRILRPFSMNSFLKIMFWIKEIKENVKMMQLKDFLF